MRTLLASVVAVLVLSAQVLASTRASDNHPRVVTLLLYVDVPQEASTNSVEIMKRELQELLNSTTLRFDFIDPESAKAPAYFQTLVSVRLTGTCNVELRAIDPSHGPLAFAHSSDGRILPFVEVKCDRVRNHVRAAFWGPDTDRSEYLYGRALARVLAHELYHVLTGRKEHTSMGLTRKSLSGNELICDECELSDFTAEMISNGLH
jgi:hypothetical protein